jgi:hypothetical protein
MSARRAAAPPPLRCPIPPAISPYAAETQHWLTGWLRRTDVATSPSTRRRIEAAGFARYAARLYPDADRATLRTLSQLFTWFFLLDDVADSTVTQDTDRLGELLTGAVRVLRHDDAPAVHAHGVLHHMLADIWRTPSAAMPHPWRDRFVDAVRHHLAGVLAEAESKAAGRRPGVAEYVRLRRATSAAYVAHVLTEFAARAPLPDAVHGHPAVQAYSTAGNDLLSWFNDLMSLERDEVTAGGHNLVLALAAERELSIREAVDAATVMWRERMDGFAGLRAAVPSFGRAMDVPVRHYLRGVERSVRGTIDWSLESARYQAPQLVAPYLSGPDPA